jgi:excisionase family DNA binding protein/PAS domain S-box-containing protein
MEKTLFSTPELAEWLGVFHTTVRRWIERGRIRGIRVGRNYKIPADEVVRILDGYGIPLPESVRKYKNKQRKMGTGKVPHPDDHGSVLRKLLVVEETQDPAFICRNGAILGANEAFARLVGFSQADLIGVDLSKVVAEGAYAGLVDFARKRAGEPGEQPYGHEVLMCGRNNGKTGVKISARSVEGLDDVCLMVVKEVCEARS